MSGALDVFSSHFTVEGADLFVVPTHVVASRYRQHVSVGTLNSNPSHWNGLCRLGRRWEFRHSRVGNGLSGRTSKRRSRVLFDPTHDRNHWTEAHSSLRPEKPLLFTSFSHPRTRKWFHVWGHKSADSRALRNKIGATCMGVFNEMTSIWSDING